MTSWQRRARVAVATFGVATAVFVYFSFGDRHTPTKAEPLLRQDPSASLEFGSPDLKRWAGLDEDFAVKAKTQLTYPDGSQKLVDVAITIRKRNGRDFTITAMSGSAGPNQKELQLNGGVALTASDGFELKTDNATYNQDSGVAIVPGAATFGRGRMSGSGRQISYDQRREILIIGEESKVVTTSEDDQVVMDLSSGTSTLDRVQHTLTLNKGVHVLRDGQELDGDDAFAQLSEMEDVVTYISLRGNARVAGGSGTLDSMSAQTIDLDYADDGQTLEKAVLTGDGAVAVKGEEGRAGREIYSQVLELALAPDGALTKAIGRDDVRLVLPPDDDRAGRSITARSFDGDGVEGQGLTDIRFQEAVEYKETVTKGPAREARSDQLKVRLDGDAIAEATFTGRATFQEQGLEARGAEARYSPQQGTLVLDGADQRGSPRVSDEQITIEGGTIDLVLEGRTMTASGNVRTTLRAQQGATKSAAGPSGSTRLPGLLKQEQPARVNADRLSYGGATGEAVYTGNAVLMQGETTIRAGRISLDQSNGDLRATGAVQSTLMLDKDLSQGRADEIRYEDKTRIVTYSSTIPRTARVAGPQGDLTAGRIDIVLAKEGSAAERLEAYRTVTMKIDTRTASGARLTYHNADERYVMTGATGQPVSVVDGCRRTTGMTLTFFKSADRIIVDGNEQIRTKTESGGPCTPPPSR
jgi:lipopolysaccharide transport protein LptA